MEATAPVLYQLTPETTAEADAAEFARVLAKNWEGGLLVARSAEEGTAGRPKSVQNAPISKLSMTRFAELADVDRRTVKKYLEAWEAAARDGLVPPAETLSPGDIVDLEHLDGSSWDGYYKTGKTTAERLVASDENEWYTPAKYIEAARAVLGGIDFDPASSAIANETVQAARFCTADENGLLAEWSGRVWLNPPYGGLAGAFVNRLVDEFYTGEVTAAIVLVNAHCTDTEWFQPLFNQLLCFTDHRIDFDSAGRDKTNSSTHGSVFAYFGDDPVAFVREFGGFGAIVRPV